RWLPSIAACSNFLELNLRTYVRFRDDPAVLFLRLYGGSWLAVQVARWLTPLPYECAKITKASSEVDWLDVRRRGQESPFDATFSPTGPGRELSPGTLDEWLLERYRAYVPVARGCYRRMTVVHPRWHVREVRSEISAAGLGSEWGLELSGPPDRCHYSDGLEA